MVYVCYNGKVVNIDTRVPSLTQFYLKSDEEGSLYIYDYDGDTDTEAYLEETRKTSEVQDLIASVKQECDEAEKFRSGAEGIHEPVRQHAGGRDRSEQ